MVILRDISLIWTLVHSLILFFFLFEPKYPRRKTVILTLCTIVPLLIVNLLLFILWGFDKYGTLMLLTLSVPSCIIFYFLSKYKDGRFFFTFCIADTMVLEILYITNIINFYLTPKTYLSMFFIRLIIFPLIDLWVYKRLRPSYLSLQRSIQKGWMYFSLIGALFYVAMTLLMTYPTIITDRPDQLPALTLIFLLMPIIYQDIISTLRRLDSEYRARSEDNILALQVSSLSARMAELAASDDRFRMERHNFRHKLKTLASLISSEQYGECLTLLSEYNEALDRTRIKRYCQHPILDSVLSTYIRKAEEKGIKVTMGFAFPDVITVNEAELATAIANALENALNACEKVDEERRFIDVKVLNHPSFIIRIVNSCVGRVDFDENGVPINRESDHGFGTRYIAAFCEKNGGFYQFKAENDTFALYLNF